MALSTYGELKTAVANWMTRSDLGAVIPDFISLAETKVSRVLRVSEMETAADLTSTSGVATLPTDYAGWRSVKVAPYGALDYVEPNWAADEYPTGAGACVKYFTIVGNSLNTFPSFTGSVSLGYYAKVPNLSEAVPTNWLLTKAPDIYLFMALAEGFSYMNDLATAGTWTERASAAIGELSSSDNAKRYARVSARVRGATP